MADLGTVASVTVTFSPDPALLHAQLMALPSELRKVVVDNGSPEEVWSGVLPILEGIENLEILRLGENLGLAAGTNAGARYIAKAGSPRFLLILDQDSVPVSDAVLRMVEAFLALEEGGLAVGAVGPALLDPATGRHHGFHEIHGLRWRRVHPKDDAPIRCDGLNGSGTLTDFALFERLGGLDAELFIDHVDTEWSFRLASDGWLMFGIPDAEFEHRMGDNSMRIWLGKWTVWPIRSPLRHRYLFRNAIRLWSRPYVPLTWKVWVVPKLLLTILVCAIAGPSRWSQMKSIARGVADGLRGIGGAI